jgi:hypothetical protein
LGSLPWPEQIQVRTGFEPPLLYLLYSHPFPILTFVVTETVPTPGCRCIFSG